MCEETITKETTTSFYKVNSKITNDDTTNNPDSLIESYIL